MKTEVQNPLSARATSLLCALSHAMGNNGKPFVKFGPLWENSAYVLECFRRYAESEEHTFNGRTVAHAAEILVYNDPYAGTGEELSALACLLSLGCENEVI